MLSPQRYEKLCQYLHCSILANEQAGDKLAKVRPLITLCETNFRQCFIPSQNLSVDEAMIQFDGRLAWKQYMPKKPIKWGIKLWCLYDSNTGYCVAFNVYCGSDREQGVNLDLGYQALTLGMWMQWPGGPVDLKTYCPPKNLVAPQKTNWPLPQNQICAMKKYLRKRTI